MNPVVLICTHNRLEITEKNIRSLLRQSVVPKIVLVVTLIEEAFHYQKLFKEIIIVRHPNIPLGAKWQFGVYEACTLQADPLIILGSDDILGNKFIENACSWLSFGYDVIGLKRWFVHVDGVCYLLDYKPDQPLGGGRVYRKSFLDSIDWKLFDHNSNKHLDDVGWKKVLISDAKYLLVTDVVAEGLEIHAIKGLWPVMNPFNINHPNIYLISTHESKAILHELLRG